MDLRQLETFVEVCKLKSFSKAAEKLFITQPTVTSHIQNLERELGTILINRDSKNMTLTKAGSMFFKYAVDIINTCEMAKYDLNSYKGKITGHLDICSSSVPRQYVLPNLLEKFASIYPDVTFSIVNKDSKQVIQSILNWETDFGIVGARYPSDKLKYIELMKDKLLLVTANNELFPFENYENIGTDILYKEKLIIREKGSGTRELLERELKKNNISINSLKILACIEDTETIKNLVSLGAGVSFLSERAVNNKHSLEIFKMFNVENFNLKRKFYFVYHKNRQLSPLSETFKNFVVDYIKDN